MLKNSVNYTGQPIANTDRSLKIKRNAFFSLQLTLVLFFNSLWKRTHVLLNWLRNCTREKLHFTCQSWFIIQIGRHYGTRRAVCFIHADKHTTKRKANNTSRLLYFAFSVVCRENIIIMKLTIFVFFTCQKRGSAVRSWGSKFATTEINVRSLGKKVYPGVVWIVIESLNSNHLHLEW